MKMLRNRTGVLRFTSIVVATFTLGVLTSTPTRASAPSQPAAAANPTLEAKVSGTLEQMKSFDSAFRAAIGNTRFGCAVTVDGTLSDCAALGTAQANQTVKDLTYVVGDPHAAAYSKFGAALDKVTPKAPAATLTFAVLGPPSSSQCIPPHTSPCVDNGFCIQFSDRCSTTRPACNRCGP
jgi:hypothetical protein